MSTPLCPTANGLAPSPPSAWHGPYVLSDVAWDTTGPTLVWLEGRSDRGVLLAQAGAGQAPRELTPELAVRARVGYGGGDFTVGAGQVYFVAGGRIYRQPLAGGLPQAITPAFGDAASPSLSPDGRWLAYVHSYEGIDRLAVVASDGSTGRNAWPKAMTFTCSPAGTPMGANWPGSPGATRTCPGTAPPSPCRPGLGRSRPALRGALPGHCRRRGHGHREPAFSPDGRYSRTCPMQRLGQSLSLRPGRGCAPPTGEL
jgi:hypothetical protein